MLKSDIWTIHLGTWANFTFNTPSNECCCFQLKPQISLLPHKRIYVITAAVVCLRGGERGTCLGPPFSGSLLEVFRA